jgi:hypothetical protein
MRRDSSMNDAEFRAQVEQDYNWRDAELRILSNQQGGASTDVVRSALRRAQVVMLYAHFEGFCKIAFSTYLQAINQRAHLRSEVCDVLAATSLAAEFAALDSGGKLEQFRTLLPADSALHRFGRQASFVRHLNSFWTAVLQVPVEAVIETGSNLEPIVLRKFLYRLGFDPEMLSAHEGQLHRLVHLRHKIAHGEAAQTVEDDKFVQMLDAARAAMIAIMRELTTALREERYRRP